MPETTRKQPRVKRPTATAKASPTAASVAVGGETGQAMGVAEFCGLDQVQMRVIDLKVSLVLEIKRRRQVAGMTQAQLANSLGVATPRITEMESGREGVSLDAMFAAFFSLGGTGADLAAIGARVDSLVRI